MFRLIDTIFAMEKFFVLQVLTGQFFNEFTKKLLTVGKTLERLLKWDQPGSFRLFRLIFTGKIRTIVKRNWHEKYRNKT